MKNSSHLENWVTNRKWVTFKKVCHCLKNGSELEKWIGVRNIFHSWKNGLKLKNVSVLKTWVRVRIMGKITKMCQLEKIGHI